MLFQQSTSDCLGLCTMIKVPPRHSVGTQGDLWCGDTRDAAFPTTMGVWEGREEKPGPVLLSSWRSVNKISRLWDNPETNPFSKCAVRCGAVRPSREGKVGCRTCFNTTAFGAWTLMRLCDFFFWFFFSSLKLAPHQTPPPMSLRKVLSVIWLHFLPL